MQKRDFTPDALGPLDGVRILDLSRLVAGNITTHVLADLGCEVIKVEKPGRGDDLRNWITGGVSAWWQVYARNKKSIALDLRSERGREILLKLAGTAQGLVENFRPGTLEKMGLGPDVLHRVNPKLVVLRVSGWGQDGPFKHKPGFGTLIEAFSGFAAMNGYPDRPPVLPAFAMADAFAGLYGATALLTALRTVEVGHGAGQVIDLSLIEPILAMLGPKAAEYRLTGQTTPRMGSRCMIQAPRDVYACADGKYVALSTGTQGMAERLMRAIGRPEWVSDPRFSTNAARLANRDEIEGAVAAFVAARSQPKVLEFFDAAEVTVGPVNDEADLAGSAYVDEREVLVEMLDPAAGALPMHGPVPRLSATPGTLRTPAPALGEHGPELLRELGLADVEIDRLVEDAVLALPPGHDGS
ncbi:MAG: CoA transferase [Geminicoccaceae bacterium]|nr:CoA transferase [Geminicoccaceae bacterium]